MGWHRARPGGEKTASTERVVKQLGQPAILPLMAPPPCPTALRARK